MSTRGYIAFYNPETDKYEGFYNHYDNYLEGTGKALVTSSTALTSYVLEDIQKVLGNEEKEWVVKTFVYPSEVINRAMSHGCDFLYIRKDHTWYYMDLCTFQYGDFANLFLKPILQPVIIGLLVLKVGEQK